MYCGLFKICKHLLNNISASDHIIISLHSYCSAASCNGSVIGLPHLINFSLILTLLLIEYYLLCLMNTFTYMKPQPEIVILQYKLAVVKCMVQVLYTSKKFHILIKILKYIWQMLKRK